MSDLKLTAEETAIWDREYHDWAVAHSGEKARELADEHIRQRRARLEPTPTTNAPVGGVESRGAPLERTTNALRLTKEEQALFDRVASKTATTRGTTLAASIEFAAGLANGIAAARMARTADIVNDAARLAPAEPVAATVPMTRTDGYGNPNPEGTYLSPPPVVKKPLTPAEPVVKESLTTEPATTGETRTIEGGAVSARLTLDDNRVSMQVLAMDEGLRGNGLLFERGCMGLCSFVGPCLEATRVLVRGTAKALDSRPSSIELESPSAARAYFDSVVALLTAFNASRAKPAGAPGPTQTTGRDSDLWRSKFSYLARTCNDALAIAGYTADGSHIHERIKQLAAARDAALARAIAATRDLAACREQVKELTTERDATERHRLSIMRDRDAWCTRATAAEAERDRLAKEVAALKARADEAKGLLAVSGCALDTDIPELTRMGRIANAAMDASQVLDGGVPWRVARDIMDAEAAALKASPPLAAVRKALELAKRHYEYLNYEAERVLCVEALTALDAAPPAAQVVEAAVKYVKALPGTAAHTLYHDHLVPAVDAYLAAKGGGE